MIVLSPNPSLSHRGNIRGEKAILNIAILCKGIKKTVCHYILTSEIDICASMSEFF